MKIFSCQKLFQIYKQIEDNFENICENLRKIRQDFKKFTRPDTKI